MADKSTVVQTTAVTTPDYAPDKVPVEVKAFDHCVYFDYPDFDSIERRINNLIESDMEYGNVSDPKDQPTNVNNREEAVAYLKRKGNKMFANGLPKWGEEVKTDQYLLKGNILDEYPETLEFMADGLKEDFVNRHEYDGCLSEKEFKVNLWLAIGKAFAKEGFVPSNRSGSPIALGEWGTKTGSYVATVGKAESGQCPQCSAELSQTQTCYSSSRRTRVPNKYKCDKEKGGCGYRYEGITTG